MKTKAHQRYKTKDGVRVPGVTTVLGILAKPALIHWAWNLGVEGKDYRKVRDQAADIGTICHRMIECELKGEEFDRIEYAPADVDKAETGFLAFLEWRKQNKLVTVQSEVQLVSERHRFGGTVDWIAKNNGNLWCIDFKTGKAVYDEMKYQIAAYEALWQENHPDQTINQTHIVRLGKEDGSFCDHKFTDLGKEREIFKHCLEIYHLKKEGKWK